MKLPIDKSGILYYASEYDWDYDTSIKRLVHDVKARGYLESCDLLELSSWLDNKKGRNRHNIKNNRDGDIEKMTKFSLAAETEEDRIDELCRLNGVKYATASAILHWFHDDDYPIFNRPALDAIGFERNRYKNRFDDWMRYVSFCRSAVKEYQIGMRTLDRALLQYSKEQDLGGA